MSLVKVRWLSMLLLGGAILACGSSVRAQNRSVNPGTAPQEPPQTCTSCGPSAPGGGFVPQPYYPYIANQTPAYGYLSGASDVINSQGQFLISKRQS